MKRNVTYILSFIEKSLGFEWIVERIDRDRINLSFVLLGKKGTPLSNFLQHQNIPFIEIEYKDKRDFPRGLFLTITALRKFESHVIHAHLFDAGRIGILAGWLLGLKTRIYTRHYSTYHHNYFPGAVVFDRLINLLSTKIVSISPIVTRVLTQREQVNPRKIAYVPHGFDFNYFVVNDEERTLVQKKYNINSTPVIGMISRYDELKGIQFVIDAVSKLRADFPNAHLVLANATGSFKAPLQKLLREKLPPGSFTEITFEENVRALYASFDVFVHVPIAADLEAFGQTYIEALAMRIPSVFTLSGIAHEFIRHDVNALVVDYKNADVIYHALVRLLKDKNLRHGLAARGYESVLSFTADKMVSQLQELYL
jgi:glycosyltransferase involved in cell wall biosynthesis